MVNKAETSRVIRLAGEDGILSKDKFVKIVQGSDFFMKSFDKNKDGEVTEVRMISALLGIRMERLLRWEYYQL